VASTIAIHRWLREGTSMSLQRSSPQQGSQLGVAKDRATTRVAWSLWAAFLILIVLAVVLSVPANTVAFSLAFGAVLGAFATVGAVVVARQPHNAVGWLCLAVGLLGSWNATAANYAEVALVVRPGSLPGGLAMGWQARPLGYIWGLTFTFLPLLFPTGRLPTRRWRPFAWVTAMILISSAMVYALIPGPLREGPGWPRNPLGIERAAAALQRIEQLLVLCTVAVTVLCAASVLVRFRRARGVERQQLKWFTYAIALFALLFIAYTLSTLVWGEWVPATASDVVFAIGYGLIPIGAGIAILRYRLYDIDRIINRTLDLRWRHPAARAAVRWGDRRPTELGHRRRHLGRGRAVPTGPPPGPAGGRPALQPGPLRRCPNDRGVQCPPARPGRPRHPHHRTAGGRRPYRRADDLLAVAAAPGHPEQPCQSCHDPRFTKYSNRSALTVAGKAP
jgi:hypothetical protein